MKTRQNELDVDFIGGEGSLTKEQEKLISDLITSRKAKNNLSSTKSVGKLASKHPKKKVKV